jgi:hypothetical protein
MLLAYPDSFGSLQRLALRHTLDRFPSNKELEIVKIFRRVLLGHADTYHIVGRMSRNKCTPTTFRELTQRTTSAS